MLGTAAVVGSPVGLSTACSRATGFVFMGGGCLVRPGPSILLLVTFSRFALARKFVSYLSVRSAGFSATLSFHPAPTVSSEMKGNSLEITSLLNLRRARPAGIEPATYGLEIRCSIH